jgi:hypothetical protein
MGSITDMCTRCLWLQDGALRMDGAPADVTAAYIRQVRETDSAKLLTRFQKEVVRQALVPGWDIASLSMVSTEGIDASTLVTGEPAMLAVDISGPAAAAYEARLRIERLDGLLVLEDRAGGPLRLGANGRSHLKVDFGPLRLNYGIYRALIESSSDGRTTARRSALFEVINPRPPRGGRPVLVYPTALRATPLNP